MDVAQNLLLYKSASNKPVNRMYWWVKGSTLRHEKKHYELYRKWFESKLSGFLQKTAMKLQRELRTGTIQPVTQENLEHKARFILRDLIQQEPGHNDTHEDEVSAMTAKEFRKTAEDLIKKGKQLEAKAP